LDVATGTVMNDKDSAFQLEDMFSNWEKNKSEWTQVQPLNNTSPPPKQSPSFFWQFLICLKRSW
jgi:hypothetical protein